jgi:hypothetical protein
VVWVQRGFARWDGGRSERDGSGEAGPMTSCLQSRGLCLKLCLFGLASILVLPLASRRGPLGVYWPVLTCAELCIECSCVRWRWGGEPIGLVDGWINSFNKSQALCRALGFLWWARQIRACPQEAVFSGQRQTMSKT